MWQNRSRLRPPSDPIRRYHERTKHQFHRYARSLGYLDWANEPDPFRRFQGAPVVDLPILQPEDLHRSPAYGDLYRAGAVRPEPLSPATLSRFFHYALGITAWKEYAGNRWSLRSNPSSGDLHPTEGYLLGGPVEGLAPFPALYHYATREHALERRADWNAGSIAELMRPFPAGAFLIGLSSVTWREAWKYGERAFRYCQHDLGHALGSVRLAAAALGWRAVLLDGTADRGIETLLGLDREEDYRGVEPERPGMLLLGWPAGAPLPPRLPLFLDPTAAVRLAPQRWHGRASRLSREDPVRWEVIDEVAEAVRRAGSEPEWAPAAAGHSGEPPASGADPADDARTAGGPEPTAGRIIIQRRSALAFDGRTSIPAGRFYGMLRRLMPRAERPLLERPAPWDSLPWGPAIGLALFVHRVEGLEPGLYALVRDPSRLEAVRRAMRPEFLWAPPPRCPSDLPLFQLQHADLRRLAIEVSCGQEIAGMGAFSLGMIAEFDAGLERHGPSFYPRLFWETGLVGQVLYLEAEAAGARATGIGCYFDDPMHDVLGLEGSAFQSLYHFAAGGPVEDARLTTLPAYPTRR